MGRGIGGRKIPAGRTGSVVAFVAPIFRPNSDGKLGLAYRLSSTTATFNSDRGAALKSECG